MISSHMCTVFYEYLPTLSSFYCRNNRARFLFVQSKYWSKSRDAKSSGFFTPPFSCPSGFRIRSKNSIPWPLLADKAVFELQSQIPTLIRTRPNPNFMLICFIISHSSRTQNRTGTGSAVQLVQSPFFRHNEIPSTKPLIKLILYFDTRIFHSPFWRSFD